MPDSEMVQNGDLEAEIPAIGFITKRMIRRDSVETLILQGIGLQLGHEAYATPFLLFIDQEAATFLRDCLQSAIQLLSAIAAQRSQHFPSEAFGMKANQRRLVQGSAPGVAQIRATAVSGGPPERPARSNPRARNTPQPVGRVVAAALRMQRPEDSFTGAMVPMVALQDAWSAG